MKKLLKLAFASLAVFLVLASVVLYGVNCWVKYKTFVPFGYGIYSVTQADPYLTNCNNHKCYFSELEKYPVYFNLQRKTITVYHGKDRSITGEIDWSSWQKDENKFYDNDEQYTFNMEDGSMCFLTRNKNKTFHFMCSPANEKDVKFTTDSLTISAIAKEGITK